MFSNVERRFLAHQRIAHLATADGRVVPHGAHMELFDPD
jgi:hypothetical protein